MEKFKILDGEYKLSTIKLYANSEEVGTTYPELQKACKEFLKQLEGGEKTLVRHPDFAGYLEDLRKVYQTATAERAKVVSKHKEDLEFWKNSKRNEDLVKGKLVEVEETYKEEMKALQQKAAEDVEAIRNGLNARITEFYSADGKNIVDDDAKLLNSGLRLTEAEINAMIDKHTGNPVMLRLIAQYCSTNRIENQKAAVYGKRALSDGSYEREIFERAAIDVKRACGSDDAMARVYSPERGLFDKLLNESISDMNAAVIKPQND